MGYNSLSENIEVFQNLINNIGINDVAANVFGAVKILGGLAIFIMIIKSYIQSTASGGNKPISWFADIIKPLLIFIILMNWITIMTTLDSLSAKMGDAVMNGANGNEKTQKIVNDFYRDKKQLVFKAKLESIEKSYENHKKGTELSDIMVPGGDQLVIFLGRVTREARVSLLSAFAEIGMTIQNLVSIMFFAYASVVLLILKVVGGIALVLSLYPSMQQSFFSWLKNFIAVHFWFAVAGLIFFVVDLIYLQTIDIMHLSFAHIDLDHGISGLAASNSNSISNFDNDKFEQYVSMFRQKIWIFLAFGLLKGILMFKVPNIVSMFVGSSSSSGGMFAAAFTPAKMAGGAAGKMLSK